MKKYFASLVGMVAMVSALGASTTVNGILYNVDTSATKALPGGATLTGAALDGILAPGGVATGGATNTNAGEVTMLTTNRTYTFTLTPDPAQAASVRLFMQNGSGVWLSTVTSTNETVGRVSFSSMTAPNFVTLTDAATVVLACDVNKTEQNATVTLGGNRTLSITGVVNGMKGVLKVKQDGTGSRTLAAPSGSIVAGGGSGAFTLTTSANAIDVLCWYYDGTNYLWTYRTNFN